MNEKLFLFLNEVYIHLRPTVVGSNRLTAAAGRLGCIEAFNSSKGKKYVLQFN